MGWSGNAILEICPNYRLTGAELEGARARFEEEIQKILSGIDPYMTEQEIELYLHDTMAARIVYNFTDNCYNAYNGNVQL